MQTLQNFSEDFKEPPIECMPPLSIQPLTDAWRIRVLLIFTTLRAKYYIPFTVNHLDDPKRNHFFFRKTKGTILCANGSANHNSNTHDS